MWKRVLVCVMALLGSCTFAYTYFQNQLSASTGNAPTYQIGDTIYYAGSTYTYVGKDGTNLFLLNNASIATNQNWDAAKTSAQNHKNSLGNLGKNMVSSELPTTTTLKQAAASFTGSGTGLNMQLGSKIPKITSAWFLGDTDLQSSNLIRFLSANNKSEGTQSIKTYTSIGSESSCQSPTSGNTNAGTGYYKAASHGGETVTWPKEIEYVYEATISGPYVAYTGPNCTGSVFRTGNASENATRDTATLRQSTYNGVQQFSAHYSLTAGLLNYTYLTASSFTTGFSQNFTYYNGTCLNATGSNSSTNLDYSGRLLGTSGASIQSIRINGSTYTGSYRIISATTTSTGTLTCSAVSNSAYTASSRPLVKVPISQILYGKSTKPVITTSNTINGNEPSNDTGVVNSYLTMETNQMNVDLRTGVSGVKGSTYEIKKTSGSTTISLPLTISGTQEGTRYVAAKATDVSGNEVYSVLSAVSSASPDVSIDYSNLINDDDSSFQIELFVLDSGIGNTMYRSLGTPITVEFQQTAASLSFTDPNTTNIKLGSSDLHETITTDNTEITTTGDNAVKYTLSGGISGTGLTVTNDPSDPKGFTLSIGNTPNPNLPADFTLTAELETTNYTKATATKQIHVFQEMSDFKWIPIKTGKLTIAEAVNNQLMGHLEVSSGLPEFTYELTSPSDSGYDAAKAKDNGSFVISNTPLNSGERAEVKTNTSLSPGIYYIQCKVTDTYGDVLYTDFTIEVSAKEQDFIYTDISGTELPKTGDKYSTYKETYAPNKTFQLYTSGNPTGSTVTYQLKNPTDVISVDKNGLVTILNASRNADLGQVIVQATSQDPSGTYDDKTIELPITIEQGTRTIEFAENPIYVSNGSASITPNILTEGVLDTDNNTKIEVDANEDSSIAWTSQGHTVIYDYDGDDGKDILLHVTKPSDRNYKVATADGILHIIGKKENMLTLSTPGKVIYGDHFVIGSTQDDSNSTNPQYTFVVSDTVFISEPKVNGNKAEFDAIRCSEGKEIEITITRKADGEIPLTKKVKVKVLPKPISIVIEDKEKKRLEENPTLTYHDFSDQLVSWNGVKDKVDTGVIKLSTTATKLSKEGSYPITTNIAQQYNDNYPNYHFTIQDGTLKVLDNGNKNFWDSNNDDCPDLNIVLGKDKDGFDIRLNEDINDDGIPELNIDSDGDGKADINVDQDDDGIPDVNIVNVKKWNPSICVKGQAEEYCTDPSLTPNLNIDLDGDGRPDINVDLDNDGIPDIDIDTDGDGIPDINIDKDKDGKPDENIKKLTEWEVDDTIFEVNGKKYQTMTGIEKEDQKYLEDNGIRIEKPNGEAFSPNLELKVTVVTKDQKDEVTNKASSLIADVQEVKKVYDVKLLENGTEVQPDGTLKIKIPLDHNIQNPILLKKNQDGTYEKVNAVIENGYLVYESDELGIVTIVADKEEVQEPSDNNSNVQGSNYPGDNVGGANTGDTTNLMMDLGVFFISLGFIFYLFMKKDSKKKTN